MKSTATPVTPAARSATNATSVARSGRLFLLELSGDRIHSMNPDGSDRMTIVTGCHLPDGIAVDAEAGHIYWTNMGVPNLDDGSIERADLDGKNRKVIVPLGVTHTPKQIHLDKPNAKLYWCEREGMRVMRANLDGSQVETLVEAGRGDKDAHDQTRWCVGITVDPKLGKIYWTQKGPDNAGLGRIFRANIDIPKGESATNRSDIEVLFDRLPEPIDLELDLSNRVLYWTDRGDPPRGNTVDRAPIDKKGGTGDPGHAFDGGHRDRPRCSRQPHVRHRLRRLGLFRRSRWQERAQLPLCPGQSHGHRLC
jgi:hypothetical protein